MFGTGCEADLAAPLTYSTLQTELLAIVARTPFPYLVPDGAFATLYPSAIAYAEQRIFTEVPLLAQRGQDTSLLTATGSRSISLAGTVLPIIVPERLALLTPSGSTLANGTQIPFIPTSLDFIDMFWPQQSITWAPGSALAAYWCTQGGVAADFSSPTVVVAPTPDAAYTVVLTGLFQQAPLSASNPQTYLSTVYPQLLAAACMIFISGALLRNYSSQGIPGTGAVDEPGQPISWNQQYETLKRAAISEEMRRRVQGATPFTQPPEAPGGGGPPGAPGGRP
jgi:hypothetical protein